MIVYYTHTWLQTYSVSKLYIHYVLAHTWQFHPPLHQLSKPNPDSLTEPYIEKMYAHTHDNIVAIDVNLAAHTERPLRHTYDDAIGSLLCTALVVRNGRR